MTIPTMIPHTSFTQNDESWAWSIHKARTMSLDCRFQISKSWASDADFPDLPDAKFTFVGAGQRVCVYSWENASAFLSINDGSVFLDVCAMSEKEGLDWVAVVEEHLPAHVASDTDVPVTFWFDHPQGPRQMTRMIAVAPWENVRMNYTAATRAPLDAVMTGFQPSVGGQLMLWQGVPGTGKTHALRALASEWRQWADLHYIVDPDNLFGRSAHYLLQVLLTDMNDDEGKWKVLVLEDTGELLAADAKAQTGQALSRLLNVVDGLIGQGLRILVLVTTNEELKTLHPAVARPGRCASQVTFQPFTASESAAWLERHGVTGATTNATLAELYAKAGGLTAITPDLPPRVGFGA